MEEITSFLVTQLLEGGSTDSERRIVERALDDVELFIDGSSREYVPRRAEEVNQDLVERVSEEIIDSVKGVLRHGEDSVNVYDTSFLIGAIPSRFNLVSDMFYLGESMAVVRRTFNEFFDLVLQNGYSTNYLLNEADKRFSLYEERMGSPRKMLSNMARRRFHSVESGPSFFNEPRESELHAILEQQELFRDYKDFTFEFARKPLPDVACDDAPRKDAFVPVFTEFSKGKKHQMLKQRKNRYIGRKRDSDEEDIKLLSHAIALSYTGPVTLFVHDSDYVRFWNRFYQSIGQLSEDYGFELPPRGVRLVHEKKPSNFYKETRVYDAETAFPRLGKIFESAGEREALVLA